MSKKSKFLKHIYQTSTNTYSIDKSINGKRKHFKTCKTLNEAVEYRDKLIANNWQPLPLTPKETLEKNIKEYFKRLQLTSKRYYSIRNDNDEYIGASKSIEEALYFRDLYRNVSKDEIPDNVDLRTNNPYLKEGLKYPLPERLIKTKNTSTYGKGSIIKKGETSYHIHHGKKGNGFTSYVCACPTYEMAEYVRNEMNKVNWDKSKLQSIIDNYPKYYTWLLYFYQYISKNISHSTGKQIGWKLAIPKSVNGSLEFLYYSDIRDALFERDFLKEHDWDYNLLVETINDDENPYYNMNLPSYPSRKIRNISERNYHEKELNEVINLIKDDCYSQEEICEKIGISPITLRNWLGKFWNTNYAEFSKLVLDGENPLEVLEKVEHIYQPDLSRALPNNWNNWVSYLKKSNRWQVRKGNETFGVYESEKLAHKISNDLQKVNWDKSKLKDIQAKYGHISKPFSKKWVYKQGNNWAVRRKDKNKKMITYGVWHDKRIAIIVRDMLLKYGFNLDNRDWIVEIAEWVMEMQNKFSSSMFGKTTIEDIIYIEDSCNIPYCRPSTTPGKYHIVKTVNKKQTYFGTYPEEKAAEVVEFLEDNNWDKNLLQMMEEMGEI